MTCSQMTADKDLQEIFLSVTFVSRGNNPCLFTRALGNAGQADWPFA